MKSVRYGIVGLGYWAQNVHIPNLLMIRDAEIVALCSRSTEKIERAAALCLGTPRHYQEFDALLGDADVDAVVISTPNGLHERMTIAALQAGKHVLCEKPMAMTVEGCDRVAEVAAKSGKVYQVGQELRYAPAVQREKQLIREGAIGEPRLAWSSCFRGPFGYRGWRGTDLCGGALMDVGIHYLDLANYMAGSKAERVFTSGGMNSADEDFDHGWITIEYENGTRGSVCLCFFASRVNGIGLGAAGDRGRMDVKIDTNEIVVWPREGGCIVHRVPSGKHPVYEFRGTYELHLGFIDAIRGGTPPIADAEAGRDAVAVTIAANRSWHSGTPEPVWG